MWHCLGWHCWECRSSLRDYMCLEAGFATCVHRRVESCLQKCEFCRHVSLFPNLPAQTAVFKIEDCTDWLFRKGSKRSLLKNRWVGFWSYERTMAMKPWMFCMFHWTIWLPAQSPSKLKMRLSPGAWSSTAQAPVSDCWELILQARCHSRECPLSSSHLPQLQRCSYTEVGFWVRSWQLGRIAKFHSS